MNQRIDQPSNQIQEVLDAKAHSIDLPEVVRASFDMASQFTEEEFFLFGSTARKCILGDENPEFNDFDFLGNFDAQKVIEYFGDNVIKVYDHFRTVKVSWNGYAVDFIARPDAVTALRNSDISLSLVCIGKDGTIYDPMNYLPDFRARHVKIHNAKERFQRDPGRILRVVRFSADLGFPIEEITAQECLEQGHLMTVANTEYALNQLLDLSNEKRSRALEVAHRLGISENLRELVIERSKLQVLEDPNLRGGIEALERFLGRSDFYVTGGAVRDAVIGYPPRDFDIKFENTTLDLDGIVAMLNNLGMVQTEDVRLPEGTYYVNKYVNVVSFYLGGKVYDIASIDPLIPASWEKTADVNINGMIFDNSTKELLNAHLSFDVVFRKLRLANPDTETIDALKVLNVLKMMSRIDGLTLEGESLEIVKNSIANLPAYFRENPHMRYRRRVVTGNAFTPNVFEFIMNCPGGAELISFLES